MKRSIIVLGLFLLSLSVQTNDGTPAVLNAENRLFIITIDGVRWQEVFEGADPDLISGDEKFLAGNRTALLPFIWKTVARQGAVYGNRNYQNKMDVANPYRLSYPGYNELLTGHVDLSIFSNQPYNNKNLTILELLNTTKAFRNKVAAFASWDAFDAILNKNNSSFFINTAFRPVHKEMPTPGQKLINKLQREIEDEKNIRADKLSFLAALEYIEKRKPSVVFLGLGETDEAAHKKSYKEYLHSLHNADKMIGLLWNYAQSNPHYADRTTFLITTDHGRGRDEVSWAHHGMSVKGSSETWMALIGNGIAPVGEKKNPAQLYQRQLTSLMMDILSYSK